MKKIICDFCFKEYDNRKDLRKQRNSKTYKCKECQEKDKKPKISWYVPIELLQVTCESGGKLIGFYAPSGQFMAINKLLDDFMKPFKPAVEFVCHIKKHLDNDPKLKCKDVICNICNKSIDEIWDESEKLRKQKEKKTKG